MLQHLTLNKLLSDDNVHVRTRIPALLELDLGGGSSSAGPTRVLSDLEGVEAD